MKRKFDSLHFCEKSYSHLDRGQIVSLALINMAEQNCTNHPVKFQMKYLLLACGKCFKHSKNSKEVVQ
jgi:hypothetical protein